MGDEDLKKKKKIRGGHNGYVTKTLERIQSLLDRFEPTMVNQLKTYRIALEEKLKILGSLDDEILGLLKEDQIEEEIEETGNFRESIHEMMVKIDEVLLAEVENNSDKYNLDVLLRAFDSEIEARERCELIGNNLSEPAVTPVKSNVGRFIKARSGPYTASALVTQSGEKSVSCTYCRQRHPSARCTTITDIVARRNLLKQQGHCFLCLRRSHLARNCPSSSTCHDCSGKHHVSICGNAKCTKCTSTEVSDRRQDQERKSLTTVYVDSNTSVLLQTAIGEVSSINQPHTGLTIRILFDSGSQRSYMTKHARNKLNLSAVKTEKLLIKTFGQENEQLKECDVVEFCVKGLGVDSSTVQMTAHVVPLICSPLKDQSIQLAQQCYEHLVDLELADCPVVDCGSEVDILIGNDIYWCFFTGDLKRGEFGPVAMKTTLGWVLSGPLPKELSSESEVNLATCHTLRLDTSHPFSAVSDEKDGDPLVEEMKKFWELESIGVLANEASVHDKFLDTIHKRDGRYEVSLPWKEHHPLLPDNYEVAVSRLNSVLKRLRRNPELLTEYNRIIEEQSSKGIISEVDSNSEIKVGRLHYLPQHPVIREDKQTTKV